MAFTNQPVTITLSGGVVTLTIGPYGFQKHLEDLKAMARTNRLDPDVLWHNIVVRLVNSNVDLTNLAAIKTAVESATYPWQG